MTEDHTRLVELARELITKVRAHGHDVVVDRGSMGFRLGVVTPAPERPVIRNGDWGSFAVGVDLAPYVPIFESPNRDLIFAEALGRVAQYPATLLPTPATGGAPSMAHSVSGSQRREA
jgi:hypothetical protein